MNQVTSDFFRLFNSDEDFYECHELFEMAWKAADNTDDQIFYKSLVQVATAQFKLKKGVLLGVRKLYDFAAPQLAKLPGVYQNIDIARLRKDFQQQVSQLPDTDEIAAGTYADYGLSLLKLHAVHKQ